MFPVAALSAFLNNTPVVAMFVPLVTGWARRCRFQCFADAATAFVRVDPRRDLHADRHEHQPRGRWPRQAMGSEHSFRDLRGIRAARHSSLGIGMLFMRRGGSQWLLKDREGALLELGKAREYTIAMRVEKGSPVIGESVGRGRARWLATSPRSALKITCWQSRHQRLLRKGDRVALPGSRGLGGQSAKAAHRSGHRPGQTRSPRGVTGAWSKPS